MIVSCKAKKMLAVIIYMYSTAVKLVNALNKLPLKYHLVIRDSARSNYIESVTQ